MTTPASAEPTAEQREMAESYRIRFATALTVGDRDHVDAIARALAAAVTAEREKVRKVLQLHTRDLDGGRDEEYWICQECDRAWPCQTVTLLREVTT